MPCWFLDFQCQFKLNESDLALMKLYTGSYVI